MSDGDSGRRDLVGGFVVWFTGLSASGKTTIANIVEPELERCGLVVDHLDGDIVRTHLSKGLYAAAFAGEIDDFTGVSAPYEEPREPELRLDTTGQTPPESAAIVLARLAELNLFPIGQAVR